MFLPVSHPVAQPWRQRNARRPNSHSKATPATAGDAIFVTNCNDAGPGSLRAALAGAGNGDEISLQRLVCSTITLQSGALVTSLPSISLVGPGADQLAISGAGQQRVIDHTGSGTLTVQGLTLRDGKDIGGGCIYSAGTVDLERAVVTSCMADDPLFGNGGGIFAQNLVMVESRLTDNRATNAYSTGTGGGAFVRGNTSITRSTISGNSAQYDGGGLFLYHAVDIDHSTLSDNHSTVSSGKGGGLTLLNFAGDERHLDYDTFSGNSATASGGALFAYGDVSIFASTMTLNAATDGGAIHSSASTTLTATIVSGNTSTAGSTDIAGSGTIFGHSDLVGSSIPALPVGTLRSDPLLGPLADNGGPTFTHALLAGSPAIDAVADVVVPLVDSRQTGAVGQPGTPAISAPSGYDQRGNGAARHVGIASDIGAYEVQTTGVTHTVSSCADNGDGSLRAVINGSRSGDTIDLRSLGCATITLGTGALSLVQGNLTLVGPGAGLLTIDANHTDRAMVHEAVGTLKLSGMTIVNGFYSQSLGLASGGCIYAPGTLELDGVTVAACEASGLTAHGGGVSARRLLVSSSTIRGNGVIVGSDPTAFAHGGGMFAYDSISLRASTVADNLGIGRAVGIGMASYGDVVVTGSTVSGNRADAGAAAGIFSFGVVRMVNSTVSDNTSLSQGGIFANNALVLSSSTVTNNTTTSSSGYAAIAGGLVSGGVGRLQSSIVFGNSTGGSAYDIGGPALFVGANNLVGNAHGVLPPDTLHTDPLLGPLQDNGGTTPTRALSPGSPAIDHGNNAANLADDQRGTGFLRIFGAAADIGAFESQPDADVIFRDGFE